MSSITNERLTLSALLQNEDFARRTQPFLKADYFHDEGERAVLQAVGTFMQKYKAPPTQSDLVLAIKNDENISEKLEADALEVIEDVFDIQPSSNVQFLVDTAEEFCKDKAMFNAIQEAIEIYKGESDKGKGAINGLITDALGVSFDTSVGTDYLEDAEARWDAHESDAAKYAFDIEIFNKVTNGGVERKTLNLFVAGINVGKTMALISLAAMYMRMGLNVLYCSNEMSEAKITGRVDANMLNTPVNEVRGLGKEVFMGRMEKMRAKGYGKLVVKEFPTGTATANHFRSVIHEVRVKKKVKIDVLIVDYLQITTTATLNKQKDTNSYTKYKVVAEEIRALCQEEDLIGWTAAQFNRGGLDNTDPGMGDIGESTGIPATVDGMWALVRTEELDEVSKLLVIEQKSRYGDKSIKKFTIGVNINTQKLYDVNQDENAKFPTNKPQARKAEEPQRKHEATPASSQRTVNKFKALKVSNDNDQ